jgi:O-antigen ligase
MSFWPGVDKWPPPRWVWISAAVVAVVALSLIFLFGTVGWILYVVVLVVFLVLGANQRLRNMGAEEFWNSRPKDD